MADEPRCDLTELIKSQCAHCMKIPDPTPERTSMGPWFPAGYDGHCGCCGDSFDEGDLIRSDGEGGWLAECCGDDDDA